jgi:hypothetical protein
MATCASPEAPIAADKPEGATEQEEDSLGSIEKRIHALTLISCNAWKMILLCKIVLIVLSQAIYFLLSPNISLSRKEILQQNTAILDKILSVYTQDAKREEQLKKRRGKFFTR